MSNQFSVTFEGDHVKVIAGGKKNLNYAATLWPEIVETCRKHDCYKVLGISDAESPMPTIDGYDHAELFEHLGIDGRFRIGWVELNDSARHATHFVETVLANRGLPGKVFSIEEEARQWLFQSAPCGA